MINENLTMADFTSAKVQGFHLSHLKIRTVTCGTLFRCGFICLIDLPEECYFILGDPVV